MATLPYFNPLRMHPPNGQNSHHSFMADPSSFVVRLLPSTGLEGAFRVHLSPESLERLDLKVGELCQMSGESGKGYGIAWRATDKMGNSPRLRPAKMTDTLRAAFGFKEGSHVTIAKTTATIIHADKVTLADVTPSDYANPMDVEDGRWRGRATYTLLESEAIAAGATFDVSAKKRLKKRFYVEHVQAANVVGPSLFYCDDKTVITISDQAVEPALPNGHSVRSLLDTSKIGGLVAQVQELNKHLDYVLNRSHDSAMVASTPAIARHVLLHGFEGTGKSLLIKQIRMTRACKVFDLELDGSFTKVQAHVKNVFREAIAAAPSVILIDDLEAEISNDQKPLTRLLARELDKLTGTSVVVVAATRSLTNIDGTLVRGDRFCGQIELPIPDTVARREILSVLLEGVPEREALAIGVSQKTHGFTGSDLAVLVNNATWHALHHEDHEDWINVHARMSVLNGVSNGQVDGSVHSQATTEVEQATQQLASFAAGEHERLLSPTLDDFSYALDHVRPTALREVFLEKPKVHWSDIGGSEAIKQRFDEAIGLPLQHADLFARYCIKPSKGILLYGPPGCSKTMTAQAVATMYDLNFIAVKGAELISMYVGESERAVREVFRKARQAAPCVIFFDEIDAIGSEREGATKGLNVLTTLLNEMDGFEAMHDVLILAATNKPEVLDSALLRAGRFDSHVYVGLPTAEARRGILDIALVGLPQPVAAADYEQLIGETDGYSGAEIVRICNVAKMGLVKRVIAGGSTSSARAICRDDFQDAFGQVKKGITREMLRGYEGFAARAAEK
ncbi:AAA+-type ATPase [Friedmanniomyces endolithicus]|nr:AAA+-type ATPase [Friedmanniomyces endolithicus]KAK1824598.1 AAA+-type ATPase [Friedmanniomyces endolithicus]